MNGVLHNKGVRAIIKLALFTIYISVLCYVLFFAEKLGRNPNDRVFSYNVVPFNEISRYLRNIETIGAFRVFSNLAGNVILFLPFGFLFPGFWPADEKNHPVVMFLVAMTFSGVVELLQYMTGVGSADVDDIILNTIGAMLGYTFYQLRLRMIAKRGK